jgi:hypothetical protein
MEKKARPHVNTLFYLGLGMITSITVSSLELTGVIPQDSVQANVCSGHLADIDYGTVYPNKPLAFKVLCQDQSEHEVVIK